MSNNEPKHIAVASNKTVLSHAIEWLRFSHEIIAINGNDAITETFLRDSAVHARIIKTFYPIRNKPGISPAYIE